MAKTVPRTRRSAHRHEATVTPSSGNLFADLGLRNADELLAKADLAHAIQRLIQAQGLSQRAAARRLGVAQPDLSSLYRGRLDGFSIERMCRLLTALGQDVRIVVQPKPRSRSHARLRASVAAD
ncbi:MAG: helix-turn-helix domain-containing protein [Gemmatimonadales bacterium]